MAAGASRRPSIPCATPSPTSAPASSTTAPCRWPAVPELDGSESAPVVPADRWRQALHELAARVRARTQRRPGRRPHRCARWPAALRRRRRDPAGGARRRLRASAGRRDRARRPRRRERRLTVSPGAPAADYVTSARAFAATALVPRTYRGERRDLRPAPVAMRHRVPHAGAPGRGLRRRAGPARGGPRRAGRRDLREPRSAHAALARESSPTAASCGAASPSRCRRCARRRRARPGRSPPTSRSRADGATVRPTSTWPKATPRSTDPVVVIEGFDLDDTHGLGRALRAAEPGEPARGPARAGPRRRHPELRLGHRPDPAQRLPRRQAAADGAGRDRAGAHLPAGRREHGRPGGPLRPGVHGALGAPARREHLRLLRRAADGRRHPARPAVLARLLPGRVGRGRLPAEPARHAGRAADAALPPHLAAVARRRERSAARGVPRRPGGARRLSRAAAPGRRRQRQRPRARTRASRPGDQIVRWEYSSFLVDITGQHLGRAGRQQPHHLRRRDRPHLAAARRGDGRSRSRARCPGTARPAAPAPRWRRWTPCRRPTATSSPCIRRTPSSPRSAPSTWT